MRIINNRYKIDDMIKNDLNEEIYIITDLWDDNLKQYMKLLDYSKNKQIVSYFINNILEISQIHHKGLLCSSKFGVVNTINLKKSSNLLYYIISEFTDWTTLDKSFIDLDLRHRLNIILDLMSVIDYLHFRGFTYKFLYPEHIFYSPEEGIKLLSLVSLLEKSLNLFYDNNCDYFFAPEVLMDTDVSYKADYYSIGMIMKYLLLKNHSYEQKEYKYLNEFQLSAEKESFLTNTMDNLVNYNPKDRNISLRNHINNIIHEFNLDYTYDLIDERNQLFYRTKAIGFDDVISQILNIDNDIKNHSNLYKACILKGASGIGKTKVLEEVSFRLRINGNQVFNIDISDNDTLGNINLAKLIKKISNNTTNEIIKKYAEDFGSLLPEYLDLENKKEVDLSQLSDRYKIYNRICSLILDTTKEEAAYLVIDNFECANEIFLQFIDYLFKYLPLNKLFLVMSFNDGVNDSNKILEKLQGWGDCDFIKNISLDPLSQQDTEILIKSILGISYIPHNFSAVIFNASRGNPSYIDFIIKDLYERGELYLHKDGYWDVKSKDYKKIVFPTNYNDTIVNLLNKYDDGYLNVIKAMSIYNIKMSKYMLLDMVDMDLNELSVILDGLIIDNIVVEDVGDWGFLYNLVSDDLKRYVYLNILEDERIRLHKIASMSLLEDYSNSFRLVFDELIYHLLEAKEKDTAIEYILNEIDKIDSKNPMNSLPLWEKAYSIVENINQKEKINILDNLADIYLIKGDMERAYYYLERLAQTADVLNDLSYKIKSEVYKAEIHLRKNQLKDLEKLIESLEMLSKEQRDYDGLIQSLILKAKMMLSSDELDKILDITDEALTISKNYKIDKHMGTIYNIIGIVYNLEGNIDYAIELFKKSINYYKLSDKPYEVVKPINNIGNIYSSSMNLNKSLEYFEQALEISRKYGLQQLIITCLNNIGEVYSDKLDYEKAIEYLKEAKRIAEDTNDIKIIFFSNINLGNIDLRTGQLEKAYKVFQYLDKINSKSPVRDGEVKCQYNNFLGEFYFVFGDLVQAEEYSKIACDLNKEVSIKEYLRAESRLVIIKYLESNIVDKEAVYSIIRRYEDSNIMHDKLVFILNLTKHLIFNGHIDFAKELMQLYNRQNLEAPVDYLTNASNIIESILRDNKDSLMEVERLLLNRTDDYQMVDLDFIIYLGNKYLELGNYSKALRHYLEALDTLYKLGKNIPESEQKYNLISSKRPDLLKEKIVHVMKKGYNKNIEINNTFTCNDDDCYNEYFDISVIIENLSKEEFYDILCDHDNNLNIIDIDELLTQMGSNYLDNLNLILKYIGVETIAKRGMIIKLDEDTGEHSIISSLNEGDNKLPSEILLLNALRSKTPFLFNRSIKQLRGHKVETLLPHYVTGLICVPILSCDRYNIEKEDRRKWESIHKNKLMGYVYLETTRALNRFDLERYKLVNSLTNLITLNIENNNLRKLSTTDKVTGTYTRKYFDSRFDKILEIYKHMENSFSLLMIDIDKFKVVNDTYGHLKGDSVLTLLGKSIIESTRESDLVGRYGGEEFVVLLINTTIESCVEVADKIRSNIEKIEVPGINRPITVSIGISQYPEHGIFKDELISKADKALYYAKEVLGRNKVALWYPKLDVVSNKIDKLAGLITGDITKDNRNILALADIADLIKENKSLNEKAYDYLGRIVEIVDGEYASLLLYDNNVLSKPITRKRKIGEWINDYSINYKLINKVLESKKGETFIDWFNLSNQEKVIENPNWQSILIYPLVKDGVLKGVVYITTPLKEKEFDSVSLNLCGVITNIFIGNI